MTPHSSSNSDDDGRAESKVTNSPCVGNDPEVHQLKEMENKMNEMQEKILSLEKEYSDVKLEKQQLEQRLLEKDEECNMLKVVKDVGNQRLEKKDKELQVMKAKMESLEQRNLQLETQLQAMGHVDDPSSESSEVVMPPFREERSERNSLEEDDDNNNICVFCASAKEDSQDWDFHYNNCPDSLKWRGDDTNHSSHYQRMLEVRVTEP